MSAAVKLTDEELFEQQMADPMWRICNLYKIMIKEEDENGEETDEEPMVLLFQPNRAQRRFIKRLWHRNIILKARQLGFTTLIAILWLDAALFNPNIRAGIIAHTKKAAEVIFRDKVKFAYENLPEELRAAMPLKSNNAEELVFEHNNSSIRVSTSMRSGTIHYLHVSEFGKICAEYPIRANEIVTGSLPAVPTNGIAVIESTAEGADGNFFKMTQRAKGFAEERRKLNKKEYRLHFYAWWEEPNYVLPGVGVIITDKDRQYFARVESLIKRKLTIEQKAWYVSTRDNDLLGDDEKMWQEYPSYVDEAFQRSTEGCYYTKQFTLLRTEQRICDVPYDPNFPVNTFWDIGARDGTGIWFHQRIGMWNHFIRYIEGWGESYSHFVAEMQSFGYVWGKHYLPHDVESERQLKDTVASPYDMLSDLGLRNIIVVPRVDEVIHGIQQTRAKFPSSKFDQTRCKEGLVHLELYRKEWNARTETWRDIPRHDQHSEAADAFRQFGQGYDTPIAMPSGKKKKPRNWKTA